MPQTIIKMNYDAMAKMATVFGDAANTLEGTIKAMNEVIELLHQGALKGDPGDQIEQGLRDQLLPKLTKYRDKMNEEKGDIQGAIGDMKAGDSDGAGKF